MQHTGSSHVAVIKLVQSSNVHDMTNTANCQYINSISVLLSVFEINDVCVFNIIILSDVIKYAI